MSEKFKHLQENNNIFKDCKETHVEAAHLMNN